MLKLDDLDKHLLSMLKEDARSSFADIARRLKVSEGTVHLRVQKLRKIGVIKGFYTIVAPDKVGKGLTVIMAVRADPAKYPEVLSEITAMKDVYEVYDVTGEFYAVLKIRTSDMKSLTKTLDEIGGIKGIVATQTMICLRTVKEIYKIEV